MTTSRAGRRIRFRFPSEKGIFLFQHAQTVCWTPSAYCLKGSGLVFFPRKQLGRNMRSTTHFHVVSSWFIGTSSTPHMSSCCGAVLSTWTVEPWLLSTTKWRLRARDAECKGQSSSCQWGLLLTLSSPVMPFGIIILLLFFICYNFWGLPFLAQKM
jgi:hypothetical protein